VTRTHAIHDLFVENPPIETIIARLYGHTRSSSNANEQLT
jgi:hypothetical protein